MSTSRSILPFNGLPIGSNSLGRRSQGSARNPNHLLVVSKGIIGSCFLGNGLRLLNTGLTGLVVGKPKMAVCGSVLPGAPLPSDPSPGSWKVWIFGMIATVIIPFLGNKWGPLLKLKREVDAAADRVEAVAEAIEKVAEQVDKVAEDIGDDLPAGGKLKEAVTVIEHLAEKAAKDAQLVDDTIEKFEEVEKQVESLIEPLTEEAKPMPKEAKVVSKEAKVVPKEANGQL
ncbi:uncharacterized protein LOC132185025 [Corylus avellana]|uniref:uncharacterized protein LOC132185025 n=1 Tax=Corylus avellana TaxID=13451 RepID=UPI00286B8CFA|nr:uncharacterized protein LOC132185025 [Corylus avellana]